MATLQGAKLANSLMPNASHLSLGSANDFNNLVGDPGQRQGRCLLFVYYQFPQNIKKYF
jgi:hypothetical protein